MIYLYFIYILSLKREYYNKYRKYININKLNYSLKAIVKLLDIIYNNYNYERVKIEDLRLQLEIEYPNLSSENFSDIDQTLTELSQLEGKDLSDSQITDAVRAYIDRHYAHSLVEALLPMLESSSSPDAKYKLSEVFQEWGSVSEELENRDRHIVTDDLDEIFEIEQDDSGYEWFCEELTYALGKIKPCDLGLIFAAPNTGKTAFVLSIATSLVKQGCRVLHINNEERGTKVKLRFLENYFNKNKNELFYDREYYNERYIEECADKYILYNVSELHVLELKNLIQQYEPEVVLIDQAWKLRVRKEDRQDMTLQAIWNNLRIIAKDYNVHIIGTQQSDSSGYDNRKLYLPLEAIHGSKIGVQGELDYAIGINLNSEDVSNPHYRYISTPKNKNTGKEDTRLILSLDKERSKYINTL